MNDDQTCQRAESLARQLIQVNTVNPPGNESDAVRLIAPLLHDSGFSITEVPYKASGKTEGHNRSSLIASYCPPGVPSDRPGVMLSGHLDTVPLGAAPWSVDPFSAEIRDGRIFGRGAADMKSGVAVLVATALQAAAKARNAKNSENEIRVPLTLVLSADEEVGCTGVASLVEDKLLPPARCILVAEPTGNIPRLGHKGVFWLKAIFHGKTAHAAFPELGDNALVKAAGAVLHLSKGTISATPHPMMGNITLVTSRLFSGDNYNSVPDRAELGLDIRSTVNMTNSDVLNRLKEELAPFQPEFDIVYDLPPLWTDPDEADARTVLDCCDKVRNTTHSPEIVTFYTDGGILGPGLGNVPVIVLGPGDSGMAHKVDESIGLNEIHEGVAVYREILSRLLTS